MSPPALINLPTFRAPSSAFGTMVRGTTPPPSRSWMTTPSAAPRRRPMETSCGLFDCLPGELINHIAAFLPLSAKVAFSLCNHPFQRFLRMPYSRLRDKDVALDRRNFLQALDRDLPNGFYCWGCHRLHLFAKDKGLVLRVDELFRRVADTPCAHLILPKIPSPANIAKYAPYASQNRGIDPIYHSGFLFEHVSMAMKLHRSGRVGEADQYLQKLRLDRPRAQTLSLDPDYAGLYYFEPRIINHVMVIRAQTWTRASCYHFPSHDQFIQPCSHIKEWLYSRDGSTPHPDRVVSFSRIKKGRFKFKRPSVPIMRCRKCHTEFAFHSRHIERDGHGFSATALTKWQIVGVGLTPEGLWSRPWNDVVRTAAFSKKHEEPGLIRNLFESQPQGHPFDCDIHDDDIWSQLHHEDFSAPKTNTQEPKAPTSYDAHDNHGSIAGIWAE